MTYDERVAAFKARIDAGEKVEAGDWMPDEYRQAALKFIEMHANSEVMGALPEGTWIPRAPTLKRKLSPDGEGPGRGRTRPDPVPGRRGPRQEPRADVRRPGQRQDEVPQRLPLPGRDVGRRRRTSAG